MPSLSEFWTQVGVIPPKPDEEQISTHTTAHLEGAGGGPQHPRDYAENWPYVSSSLQVVYYPTSLPLLSPYYPENCATAHYRLDLRFWGWLTRMMARMAAASKSGNPKATPEEQQRVACAIEELRAVMLSIHSEDELSAAVDQEIQNPQSLPKDDPDTLCVLGVSRKGICAYLENWKPEYAATVIGTEKPTPKKPKTKNRPDAHTKGSIFDQR